MNRIRVSSAVFSSVGYDLDRRLLEIEFVSGAIYRYFNVPDALYIGLMAADSHGEFFSAHIRDAGFEYDKIS